MVRVCQDFVVCTMVHAPEPRFESQLRLESICMNMDMNTACGMASSKSFVCAHDLHINGIWTCICFWLY